MAKDVTKLIGLLERLSLVEFANKAGIERLQEAIKFADTLKEVNTENVKPIFSVHDDDPKFGCIYMREDKAEATNREDVTKNATKLLEDYFVAPPGNIPLVPKSFTDYDKKSSLKEARNLKK